MDKKYQIFISSTYVDLREARHKVMDTILELHQIPAGMEMFPAADDDQWTHIKSEIDKSDYYVLILGHRYGSMASDGISYTEKEYDYAREKNIPVLAFIMDRDAPVRASDLDDSATARKKLEKFVLKAQSNKLCKFWTTPDELATKVSTSLSFSFATNPRVGWVRGDQAVSPQIAEELVALNRENRLLKEELEGLRVNKVPVINLEINNGHNVELNYRKLDHVLLDVPSRIDIHSIPDYLSKYITEKAVEEYNESVLEDIDKVQKYNNKQKLYEKIVTTGFEINFNVVNVGSIKANNIYVDIEFPDSVLVLEGKIEDFDEPEMPTLKVNPLEKAQSLYERSHLGAAAAILTSNSLFAQWENYPQVRNVSSIIARNLIYPNSDLNSRVDDNVITVHCKELIHTRRQEIGDAYTLVPKFSGNFEVKVSVICEEYATSDEFTLPLIIHEK